VSYGGEIEARARLQSIAEILDNEADALTELGEERLTGVLIEIEEMQASITRTLIALAEPPANGG
jgi:hypothetical protein